MRLFAFLCYVAAVLLAGWMVVSRLDRHIREAEAQKERERYEPYERFMAFLAAVRDARQRP
jgi:hypothetical protein